MKNYKNSPKNKNFLKLTNFRNVIFSMGYFFIYEDTTTCCDISIKKCVIQFKKRSLSLYLVVLEIPNF